jgi:ubiquitin-conjugating enzyme E2 W
MVVRWVVFFSLATYITATTTHPFREVHGISRIVPITSRIKVNNDPIIDQQILSQRLNILTDIPRGGGSSDDINLDDSDDNDGMIIQKVKNIIRSILKSTKDVPIIQSTISSLIQWIETSIGVQLLPQASTVGGNAEKIKKKKKRKKQIKKKSETIVQDDVSDKGSSKSAKKSIGKNASTATKSAKSKSVSAATSMQVKKSLKATNPNYRIQQELKSFLLDPPKHLSVRTGKNIRIWIVTIEGIGIYEGETFRLRIQFPNQYPTVPPSVYFLPPNIPVHEHVYTNGDICLSLLGKDWRPTMTAQSVAHSILSILTSATSKTLPMDNARHAGNQPGQYQENWVYHDDNC